MRRGFTFIEVLCVLLILTVGMLSAIAVLRHGVRLSQTAQSASLAFPTARTLLYDTSPSGVDPADWGPAGAGAWQGFVNGMWSKRTVTETTVSGNTTYATVKAEVFWSDAGDRSVTLVERIGFYAP